MKTLNTATTAAHTEEQRGLTLCNEFDAIHGTYEHYKEQYALGVNGKKLGHFYVPIPFFKGRVMKYQGIVNTFNLGFLKSRFPDGVLLDSFKGDRITTDTHTLYTTM